jgi:hypothetical protein
VRALPGFLGLVILVGLLPGLSACGTGGAAAAAPCEGVACSGHGVCAELDGLASCACEPGYAPSGPFCEPASDVPRILAFTTDLPELTEGDTATLTLSVTGPAGVDDPITAQVFSDDGAPLAVFAWTAPRLYTARLGWAALHRGRAITFLAGEARTIVARVHDDAGHADEAPLEVALSCGGVGACDGACSSVIDPSDTDLDLASACDFWICGSPTWPAACLERPLAWLWVPPDQLAELVKHKEEDLEADGVFQLYGRCLTAGVELHGGYALTFEKKSFKVKFNRGDDFPLDPFAPGAGPAAPDAEPGFKQLVLKATAVDPSLVRDRLAEDLTRAAGGLAPRVTYVNLALNGRYHGVYALTEAITEDYFERLGSKGDGNLYKAVNHKADFTTKDDPLAGYEKKLNLDGPSDDLALLLDTLASTPCTLADYEAHVAPLLDLNLYDRFLRANVFANNQDAFTKNYYLYHEEGPPDSPFLIVNWDADATFGRSWDGAPKAADTGDLWGRLNHLTRQLKRIPELRGAYVEGFEEALEHELAPDATRALLATAAAEVRADVRFEECRWPDKASTFEAEVEVIDGFLQERVSYLKALIEAEER